MPQPKKNFDPPRDSPVVMRLASQGCSEATIATAIGMTRHYWTAAKKRDKRLLEALERGRGVEHDELVGSLFRAATAEKRPNITAAIFLLKCRHNYIDQPKPAPEDNRLTVEFKLPAALSPAQYQKLVDVTPQRRLKAEGVADD